MSAQNLAKFTQAVAKDPALLARLKMDKIHDDNSASVSIAQAVGEGKALGLEFTPEEAMAWLNSQLEKASKGELSDSDLEAVAGGSKAGATSFFKGFATGFVKPYVWIYHNPVVVGSAVGGLLAAAASAGIAAAAVGAACAVGSQFHS